MHTNKIRIKRVDPLFVYIYIGVGTVGIACRLSVGPESLFCSEGQKVDGRQSDLTISVTRGARDTCNHHVTWVLVKRPAVEIYGTRHLQGVFFIIIILFY